MRRSERLAKFLDFTVQETLAGHADLRRFYLASGIGQLLKEAQ